MAPHHGCGGLPARLTISKDGAEICIVEIGKILGVEFAATRVMPGESGAKLPRFGNPAPARDGRRAAGHVAHQAMDIIELFERFPSGVSPAPVLRPRRQPDSKCLGKIFVGVSLGVPVGQVTDEALAIRTRRVGLWRVLSFGTAEDAAPVAPRGELIGVVHGMATFMPQEHLAPIGGAAFDFQHLVHFKQLEARMRQIKWNGNGWHAFRREPLIAQITIRPQRDAARGKLVVELLDPRFQLAVLDPSTEIADTEPKQLLIFECLPKWFWGWLHRHHRNVFEQPNPRSRTSIAEKSPPRRLAKRPHTLSTQR